MQYAIAMVMHLKRAEMKLPLVLAASYLDLAPEELQKYEFGLCEPESWLFQRWSKLLDVPVDGVIELATRLNSASRLSEANFERRLNLRRQTEKLIAQSTKMLNQLDSIESQRRETRVSGSYDVVRSNLIKRAKHLRRRRVHLIQREKFLIRYLLNQGKDPSLSYHLSTSWNFLVSSKADDSANETRRKQTKCTESLPLAAKNESTTPRALQLVKHSKHADS